MSPTDAKRGAKRRKNKRGGGSSCSTVCNTSSAKALNCAGTATPASVVSFLTPSSTSHGNVSSITGVNGEVKVNSSVPPQFTEGPVNADFSGVLQTPFTFGLNQRAPYTAGDHCLLCRCERKDSAVPSEMGTSGLNGTGQPSQTPSALQLPLWVCSDCRRTVEKADRHADRHAAMEQSVGCQDFLLHMPVGNGNMAPDPATGLTTAAPTLPMLPAPDLTAPLPTDTVCSCEACNERRVVLNSAESERETQQLQNHWSEVRYLVRCIYRQTGTPLADDHDQPLERDREGMKELVDRLCEKDPYQLYQRLEQQAREYVLEMKVRLLKHLSTGSKMTPGGSVGNVAVAQGPPQAHQFISLLLEEYNALCQAARTISSFLLTLENEHLQKFQVTWELHNKHLFENLVFSEPILHSSLPALVSQLRHGTASHDSYNEDMYRALLEQYQLLQQEMASVGVEWQECEKRIDDYVDEQLLFKVEGQSLSNQRTEPHKSLVSKNTLKTKQRMLKEDWEFFKQRRFIEDQLPNKKSNSGDNNFTDTMRMLSSRLSIPDCPNCNYRRRCTCDDCSLSHILTCGIMDSPIAEDLHIKLPLQGDLSRDYLAEVHPPSLSSNSSASGSNSSSPITIQQHPRLIHPEGDPNTFISDDDEVPPLSSKFGDIYPLSGYEDGSVVRSSLNGLHNEVNGEGEKAALKTGSPHIITSSSSSSEGDEEEADSGEPPGQQGELSLINTRSPPPSYTHQQQVEPVQHVCECHVCNQDPSSSTLGPASSLPPGRLHAAPPPPPNVGHQFFTDTKTPPTHPALHLYPHIHGHLPLHNFPRPLLHPTLYPSSPPLSHNKPLPPSPTSSHSAAKQPAFSPSLPEHVYQNCFSGTGGTGDWNSSLQCLSLKFENLWDAAVMKSWNPSMLLPESLPGDMLGPPLSDVPLPPTSPNGLQGDYSTLQTPTPPSSSTSSSSSSSSCSSSEAKEQKKSGAKKKCLYNFQDAFMETNRVVMATSASTSSVSCTATTVQSNDVFHNLGKEDHRQPPSSSSRSSSTGLTSLPPLSGPNLPPAPTTHLPTMASQAFPKMAATAPDFTEAHPGLCLPPSEPPVSSTDGPVSAPPSVCSDPDCEGHRCEGNYEHQPYDGEESQDEDSCSEHSSSTSTSTNQKEGKYCDCCYCEFFGHGGPPAAPTSRNYAEMREKLRLRLTKRKEEQPKREEQQPVIERDGGVEDHRRVEDLLQFINSADSKPVSSSKAAKRARHKQKKLEEKARLEAEAREREEQQLLEERQQRQRQEEEEAALQKELLRLQELQHQRAAKKKKKDKAKENTAPLQNNPQPLKQTAQNVLDNLQNGKSQLLQTLIRLPDQKDPPPKTTTQPSPKCTCDKALSTENGVLSLALQNGTSTQLEVNGKTKAKQTKVGPCESPPIKKGSEVGAKLTNGAPQTTDTKVTRLRPSEASLPNSDSKKTEDRGNNRSASGKRPQPLNQMKEEQGNPPLSNHSPSPPPGIQPEQNQQNGKPASAESPQPKAKNKKNKKKKGDKMNTSIDDVFLPKDIDLDSTEMDETEREVEYFKRFCLDSARQTRQRLSINWSNFSLKKATFAAH